MMFRAVKVFGCAGTCALTLCLAACAPNAHDTVPHPEVCTPCANVADAGMDAEACCLPVCEGNQAQQSVGPMLGALTEQSIHVWLRADADATLRVRYWPDHKNASSEETSGAHLIAKHDFTGIADLKGLTPNTDYAYLPLLKQADGVVCAATSAPSTFHTLPTAGAPAALRFVVLADINYTEVPVFDRIAALKPDFALFLGDTIYADSLPVDINAYRGLYRNTLTRPPLARMLAKIPIYAMWDDHETSNDFYPGLNDRGPVARQAFEEYIDGLNPAPRWQGGFPFAVEAGDLGFYFIDTRSYRSPSGEPDSAAKTMLGAQQKADFFAWLAAPAPAFRFVITPTPFNAHTTTEADAWTGYPTERAEVLSEIQTATDGQTMLVTADQHWSGVFKIDAGGDQPLYEVMPTPVAIANRLAPVLTSPDVLASDDDHRVYGVIDIDTTETPATLVYTLCDADVPCHPGDEPTPTTPLDIPGPDDNVPYTFRFTVTPAGLVVAK
jgi:phosphodiesterase/alkaline phosphatase D-like protein